MITWNTGLAAERFRHNVKMSLHRHNLKLKLENEKRKKLQAASVKPEELHAANTLSFKRPEKDIIK